MRILFALAGLHRVDRGAETAFMSVASALASAGDEVTLIGSGPPRAHSRYRYISVPTIGRESFERWPTFPLLRSETAWEEALFVAGLLRFYKPAAYDVTLTCSYPFTNWALRRPVLGGKRPPHVFVTQNGDWPAFSDEAEFRFFGCEGLICTNPDYLERNSDRYRTALVPNGVDTSRFTPGKSERERFGLPESVPIVLMVSALIPSKNVAEGIRAVSHLPDAMLVVAGDGPLRGELEALAGEHLPGRYRQLVVGPSDMPALYRSVDSVLHLSREEAFGNVFVEALACGTPLVAYDLPRTRWIVENEAFLAPPGSVQALVSQLLSAVSRDAGSRAGRIERAAAFDWSRVAVQYRQFLEQVIARG